MCMKIEYHILNILEEIEKSNILQKKIKKHATFTALLIIHILLVEKYLKYQIIF